MSLVWMLVLAIAVPCCQIVAAAEPTIRDVVYARLDSAPASETPTGSRVLTLDIFQPTEAVDAAPLIIWVHGGAWRAGSKKDVPVTRWLELGFAIASIEYRLSPEAPFPAQMHDIKSAIRFLRANAEGYHFDSQRFVIAGSSAGGHLAALAGVTNGNEELEGVVGDFRQASSDVQAIVSFYGGSNLQSILEQSTAHGLSVRVSALQLLLGGQPSEKPELARLASPVSHVEATDPPLWLVHGDADPQMPIAQSEELVAHYKKVGLPIHFDIVHNGKHGGKEFFDAGRLDAIAQQLLQQLKISATRPSPLETR